MTRDDLMDRLSALVYPTDGTQTGLDRNAQRTVYCMMKLIVDNMEMKPRHRCAICEQEAKPGEMMLSVVSAFGPFAHQRCYSNAKLVK